MTTLLGPLFALASAATFGTADFLGGLLSKRTPALAVVGWSHIGAFALMTIVVAIVGWPTEFGWLPWAVLGAVCGAVGVVAFYHALAVGTMGVVSPIASLGVVVPLLWAILSGERPTTIQVIGMIAGIVGGVLACGPEFRVGDRNRATAVMWAAFAGILFGITFIAVIQGASAGEIHTVWGMRAVSATGFLILGLALRKGGGHGWRRIGLFWLAGVLDTLGNLFLAWSSQFGLVAVSVVLASLYPVVTIVLATVILSDRLARIQWIGVASALVGVVLLNLPT